MSMSFGIIALSAIFFVVSILFSFVGLSAKHINNVEMFVLSYLLLICACITAYVSYAVS
jgi:hypothetical protein